MIYALLIAKELTFPGGTAHNLADALSALIEKPTAILRSEEIRVPKFTIDSGDDIHFRQLLKVRTGYVAGVSWTGYSGQAFPNYMMRLSTRTWPSGTTGTIERDLPETETLPGERVRIKAGQFGGSLVKDLEKSIFNGRWSANFQYQRALISFSTNPMSFDQFIDALSEALGTTKVKTASGYYLDFNSITYRRRLLAWLDIEIAKTSKEAPKSYEAANLQLSREAIRIASDSVFKKAYATEGGSAQMTIPSESLLEKLAKRRISAWIYQRNVANTPTSNLEKMMQDIDWDRPVTIYFSGNPTVAICAYKKAEANHRFVF